MEKFPQDFHRNNFEIATPRSRACKLRKDIYNVVVANKTKLTSGLTLEFEEQLSSGDTQLIISELRERGFKASSNYDIYKGKHIMTIS